MIQRHAVPIGITLRQNIGLDGTVCAQIRGIAKAVVAFKRIDRRGKGCLEEIGLDAARVIAAVAHLQIVATRGGQVKDSFGIACLRQRRKPIADRVVVGIPHAKDDVEFRRDLRDQYRQLAVMVNRDLIPVHIALRQDVSVDFLVEGQRCCSPKLIVWLKEVGCGRKVSLDGVGQDAARVVVFVAHFEIVGPWLGQVKRSKRVAAFG